MHRRKEGKAKGGFWEAIGKRLEMDLDAVGRGEVIEIRGRSRVEIGGVREICGYSPECVCLAIKNGEIEVSGAELVCVFYRRGAAAVEGHIRAIEFLGEKRL